MSVSYLKLHLFNNALQSKEDETELTKHIKCSSVCSDTARDQLLSVASHMDPRFWTSYIKRESWGNQTASCYRVDVFPRRQDTNQHGITVKSQAASKQTCDQHDEAEVVPKKKKKALASYLKKTLPSPSTPQSQADRINAELTAYLMSPDKTTSLA